MIGNGPLAYSLASQVGVRAIFCDAESGACFEACSPVALRNGGCRIACSLRGFLDALLQNTYEATIELEAQ